MMTSRESWDERYAQPEYVYGLQPNEFFKSKLDTLTTGKLLLPCEGEGRNAVYAATLGWDVDAFDQSGTGRAKCLQLAQEAGVTVNYEVSDALEFEAGLNRYDVVALCYAHFPPQIREAIHRKLAAALKPGGMMLIEAFNPHQLANSSGGPRDVNMLYTAEMLKQDFNSLQIAYLEELHVQINEGRLHSGPADVVRLVATKHQASV